MTRKVKVVTPILLKLNISKTVRDRRSVQIDYLQESPYCESNGHVTDDVTVIPKRQGRDPDIFEAQYLNNRARHMVGSY